MKRLLLILFPLVSTIGLTQQHRDIENPPQNIELCDVGNDGIELFNLTVNEALVIGAQNPADLEITYHETQESADLSSGQTDTTLIANPSSYSSSTATVWIRVFELPTGNYDFTSFELVVNPAPNTGVPPSLEVCDTDNDGFSTFDLTVQNDILTNGDNDIEVSYFEVLTDAENNVNTIGQPNNYNNIIANNQTIYARLENIITGCFTIVSFDLIVNDSPEIDNVSDLSECDDNGDDTAVFDLTSNNANILGSLDPASHSITYYTSQSDADSASNPIAGADSYENVSNPETLYTRLENTDSGCFNTDSFQIEVTECSMDEDGDGVPDEDEDLNENGNLDDDDTDEDGIPNYQDDDDDGDNVATEDEIEGIGAGRNVFIDTDEDTIENYLDDDDDGDNILTIDEDYNGNGNPLDDDTNNNGIPDFLDADVALSISDNDLIDFMLYPNPAIDIVTIEGNTTFAKASLFNVQGKLIKRVVWDEATKQILDVRELQSGLYFLKVGNSSNTYKLIKR